MQFSGLNVHGWLPLSGGCVRQTCKASGLGQKQRLGLWHNLRSAGLCRFNHPNVIKFREVFLTPTHVALAMELAPNGDLFKKVRDAKGLSVSPPLCMYCATVMLHKRSQLTHVRMVQAPKFHAHECQVSPRCRLSGSKLAGKLGGRVLSV